MRRIEKNFDAIPARLLSDACERARADALVKKSEHAFDGPYGHKDVKNKLRELYDCKCAFCETNVEAGAPFQVEHYRPKAKITTEDQADEPGYYWLAYEWSNLLLSCPNCNNHKRNKFPIGGARISAYPGRADDPLALDLARCRSLSADLQAEQPYILNPEVTDPVGHLLFWFDGTVQYQTLAGDHTIRVCNLNRDSLVAERKTIYDAVFNALLRQLAFFDKRMISKPTLKHMLREILRELKVRVSDPKKEYSACSRTYWSDFDAQFVARLPLLNWQTWVRQAYQEVVAEATLQT